MSKEILKNRCKRLAVLLEKNAPNIIINHEVLSLKKAILEYQDTNVNSKETE